MNPNVNRLIGRCSLAPTLFTAAISVTVLGDVVTDWNIQF